MMFWDGNYDYHFQSICIANLFFATSGTNKYKYMYTMKLKINLLEFWPR